MRVLLSALTFNYNPEGRGSVILAVMRTFIQFVSRMAAAYRESLVSQQVRVLTSTHTQWVELLPAALGILGMDQYDSA